MDNLDNIYFIFTKFSFHFKQIIQWKKLLVDFESDTRGNYNFC